MRTTSSSFLNALDRLGHEQAALEMAGFTVDPHQLLGLEVNPRAAAIAELVLWIGYLQWHFRTRGRVAPPEPIIKAFRNIECRDAVLAFDRTAPVLDAEGRPVTRWDGRMTKAHPVTGEEVPDETARVPLLAYENPRPAAWPEADFIVGNPPFIGTARMRDALGDGYTAAVRKTYPDVPESADFVMYWWHKAALLVRAGKVGRFGFITTNSLRQTFNRRVVEAHLQSGTGVPPVKRDDTGGTPVPLSLAFAIPDHPWVDAADGAAVRIAMTVGVAGASDGRLAEVVEEIETGEDAAKVTLTERTGLLHANLALGANVTATVPLESNSGLAHRGFQLIGSGFIVTREEASTLGLGRVPGLDRHVREYRNGRDLTDRPRGVLAIDLFGLNENEVCTRFPEVYQHVVTRVKPERDTNNRESYRRNWWVFGEPRREMRPALAGLPRYIATVETAKHRTFQFLDASIAPDNKLVVIALDDAFFHGVLSSRFHAAWALARGALLEDRPVYPKTECFEKFPFPDASEAQRARIRDLAERLDAHRKRQQREHPQLTLTDMDNVLEKLRAAELWSAVAERSGDTALAGAERRGGEAASTPPAPPAHPKAASLPPHSIVLTAKERAIHEHGLVTVLRELHDQLDAAVAEAYALPPTATDDAILTHLCALNARRAAEERTGTIRWLRPAFQNPTSTATQTTLATGAADATPAAIKPAAKLAWPRTLAEQAQAVRAALTTFGFPADAATLAKTFTSAKADRIEDLLETLASLGQARTLPDGRYVAA